MIVETKSKFFENYEMRFSILLAYQLLLLLIFRILTLFISTEGLHHIEFITPSQLQLVYLFVEFITCLLFLVNIPDDLQNKYIFMGFSLIYIILEVLYVEQFFLSSDPIILYSKNINFILLQVLVLLLLIFLSNQKFKVDLQNNDINLTMYLLLSFIFLLLSNFITNSDDFINLFILIANFLFWIFLLSLIIKYARILYSERKRNSILPILVGFFFGFGMFMGMTRNQLMRVVITTIIDQTFSLYAIQPLVFGINVQYAMIFIDIVFGFVFVAVLLVALLVNEPLRDEITVYLILGITGLAVYPLLALMRFFAFFKYTSKDKLYFQRKK